jgi:hypothetical protein
VQPSTVLPGAKQVSPGILLSHLRGIGGVSSVTELEGTFTKAKTAVEALRRKGYVTVQDGVVRLTDLAHPHLVRGDKPHILLLQSHIRRLLQDKPMRIMELVAALNSDRGAVSKALAALKIKGAVIERLHASEPGRVIRWHLMHQAAPPMATALAGAT